MLQMSQVAMQVGTNMLTVLVPVLGCDVLQLALVKGESYSSCSRAADQQVPHQLVAGVPEMLNLVEAISKEQLTAAAAATAAADKAAAGVPPPQPPPGDPPGAAAAAAGAAEAAGEAAAAAAAAGAGDVEMQPAAAAVETGAEEAAQ